MTSTGSAGPSSGSTLPPVIQLRPYQARWVDDRCRFKIAVKSARIGFSFGSGLEAVLDCLQNPNTTWTVLSASKAQSVEFIEEGVRKISEALKSVAELDQEPFVDALGKAEDILVTRADWPNGSRILALPANPRTARGFPGNTILDEFGHHEKSYAIWAASSRQVALGHKLRVLSTPNGQQGKFYDLAKQFRMTEGIPPVPNPKQDGYWSCHFVNVHMAIADGCPIDLEALRDLFRGDKQTEDQEFNCAFLKGGEAWIPLELIVPCEDEGAWMEKPSHWRPLGPVFCGIDVARDGDRTCVWMKEQIGDIFWTRHVEWIHNMPFFTPEGSGRESQAEKLLPFVKLAQRTAIDCTGLGLGLFEWLAAKVGGRVMGVNFGGSVKKVLPGVQSVGADAVKIKTDMAVRFKEAFEARKARVPHDDQLREEIQAIKREYSGSAVVFNAPRIEIEGPVAGGQKQKAFSHADAFWAGAMALLAASGATVTTEIQTRAGSTAASVAAAAGFGFGRGERSASRAATGW